VFRLDLSVSALPIVVPRLCRGLEYRNVGLMDRLLPSWFC
jgi:hypothetical protein